MIIYILERNNKNLHGKLTAHCDRQHYTACMYINSIELCHEFHMRADMTGSQFHNCDYNVTAELLRANLVRGISGAVCCLISLVLLFVLVLVFRAYRNTLQRLILYYVTVTTVYQALNAVFLEHQFVYQGQDILCAVLGGCFYYMGSVIVFLAAIIVNYSMYLVLQPSKCGPQSNWSKWIAECSCIVIALILPLTYLWTPLTNNNYGISGPYCGIKIMDEECKPDYEDLIIIFAVKEFIALEMLVIVVVTLITYCRIRMRIPSKNTNMLVQKTYFLLILYTASSVVSTTSLVWISSLKSKEKYFSSSLILATALWFPLFFEFALLLLFAVSVRISERCLHSQRRVAVHENQTEDCETNPSSHPFIQPSETCYSPPYTGGFTNISASLHTETDKTCDGEKTPLL